MTGCARFFIFLLLFTPLVLIGVSYYNGSNPFEQVKELLNIEKTEATSTKKTIDEPASTSVSSEAILKSTIDTQKETIEELRKENRELKQVIKQKDRQLQLQGSGNE